MTSNNHIRKAITHLLALPLEAEDPDDIVMLELDGILIAVNKKQRTELDWEFIASLLGERVE